MVLTELQQLKKPCYLYKTLLLIPQCLGLDGTYEVCAMQGLKTLMFSLFKLKKAPQCPSKFQFYTRAHIHTHMKILMMMVFENGTLGLSHAVWS